MLVIYIIVQMMNFNPKNEFKLMINENNVILNVVKLLVRMRVNPIVVEIVVQCTNMYRIRFSILWTCYLLRILNNKKSDQ